MGSRADIPANREFFRLNEVCKLANVQPTTLQSWGTEFDQLEPIQTRTGQRLLNRSQVELLFEIRRLLVDDRLSFADARHQLTIRDDPPPAPAPERSPKTQPIRIPDREPEQSERPRQTSPHRAQLEREIAKEVEERLEPLMSSLLA